MQKARVLIAVATLSDNSLRQTAHTQLCLCSPSSEIGSSPLKGCGDNCRPCGKYWQPTTGFITHVTCRLTAKNRDQLHNCTLGNRVWASFTFIFYSGPPAHRPQTSPSKYPLPVGESQPPSIARLVGPTRTSLSPNPRFTTGLAVWGSLHTQTQTHRPRYLRKKTAASTLDSYCVLYNPLPERSPEVGELILG